MQGKSRRILILATSYLPLIGGAELAIKDLTDRLPDLWFDLVTHRSSPELPSTERIGNVNVIRVGKPSDARFLLPKITLPFALFFEARKMLVKHPYDLIYVLQASQAGGAAWLLKRFGRVSQPLVLNLQEGKDLDRQSFLVRTSRRLILSSADHFTVISAYLEKFLEKRGIGQDKIFLMPNGVDLRVAHADPTALKERLGLKNERVVLTVSRLVEKNGIEDLLEGFVYAKRAHAKPLKLLIVGEGEMEPQLRKQAQDLGVGSAVIFVGSVPHEEIPQYLALADVFVRPSRSEGLGTSFLEAMAAGVPVIGTRVGGIVDFLEDGKTGLYCSVGDAQDIAQKIIVLLSDEALRSRLIRQSREMVERKYDWDQIALRFREFYEAITDRYATT